MQGDSTSCKTFCRFKFNYIFKVRGMAWLGEHITSKQEASASIPSISKTRLWNSSAREIKAEEAEVQGHPQLHRAFDANMC